MRETIQRYLEESFLVEFGGELGPDTDLFETQVIDSFGFVELVTFLEGTFAIKITDEDLLSHRLTTLDKIVALVEERARADSQA